jgi:hypothetical protein
LFSFGGYEEQLLLDVPSPYDRIRHNQQAGRSRTSSPRVGRGSSDVLGEAWSIYEDFDGPEDRSKMTNDSFKIVVFISGE